MQRYGDFGLIPRKLPDSCRSCCDKGSDLRQSRGDEVGFSRKEQKSVSFFRNFLFIFLFLVSPEDTQLLTYSLTFYFAILGLIILAEQIIIIIFAA